MHTSRFIKNIIIEVIEKNAGKVIPLTQVKGYMAHCGTIHRQMKSKAVRLMGCTVNLVPLTFLTGIQHETGKKNYKD